MPAHPGNPRLSSDFGNAAAVQGLSNESPDHVQTILHPISSIPNEIFREIISKVVDESAGSGDTEAVFRTSLDVKSHPSFVLSHVCQHWRAITLSTSRLWTFVHIHLSTSPFDASTASLLHLFIVRSNEHPLHVSIADEKGVLGKSTTLAELFTQSWRWQTLLLSTTGNGLRSLRHPITNDLPSLEALSLHYSLSSDSSSDTMTPRFEGFLRAPKLHSIRLRGLQFLNENVDLPWWRLSRSVLLGNPPFRAISAALGQMSALASAEIHFPAPRGVPNIEVQNRLLKSLKMVFGPSGLRPIVPTLKLPSLESLEVEVAPVYVDYDFNDPDDYEDRYQSSLTSLSPPTGQNLVALMVTMVSMQDECVEGLVEMLGTTPVLETLRLSLLKGCGTIDQFSGSLQVLSDGVPLIPDLRRLTVASVNAPGFRVSNMLNVMIESRRVESAGIAVLQEVEVFHVLELDATVEERFGQFLNAGMKGFIR